MDLVESPTCPVSLFPQHLIVLSSTLVDDDFPAPPSAFSDDGLVAPPSSLALESFDRDGGDEDCSDEGDGEDGGNDDCDDDSDDDDDGHHHVGGAKA